MARQGAVAGGEFSFAALRLAALDAAAGGLSEATLLNALDRALRTRILGEREHGYAFRHPLFAAALYHRLSRQRRMHLHAALALTMLLPAQNTSPSVVYPFFTPFTTLARST